ncbi:hypothetical protein [Gloeocapsopsis dulcis]|uniref:Uncharacterized protein n=1 Tax=Gloeocapsopsis dulcis AAB1 = 1H9 TaxID=1433147 RepID=A0A6N8G074_9CHRO|nr:hypothetical protein [Gloeocapsopsis dulcis]MUL37975.1 hypothetical protein [Gloeocapsopsis dulcis AAB1 = 1H9]WNN91549.1 hypothetical protein P0S91_10945 [Gloeocapsopsis dulcis]
MTVEIHCDRCKKPIPQYDQSVLDFLRKEYPSQDICPDCDLEITLAKECAKQDAVGSLNPGSTALLLFKRYESLK